MSNSAVNEATHWHVFLESAFPDPADRRTLQQFFGLSLVKGTTYRKALFIVGPPADTRVICRVWQALIQPKFRANRTIMSLGSRLGLESLQHTGLVLIEDAQFGGSQTARAVERIRDVISEREVTVARRTKSNVTRKLEARFVFTSPRIQTLYQAIDLLGVERVLPLIMRGAASPQPETSLN